MSAFRLIIVLLFGLVVYQSVFTVDQREYAIRFKLGEIVESDYQPGIHWMTPFINNVMKFDRRVLTLDANPDRFLTSEKKFVEVDSYVKWKIADINGFYSTTRGDEFVARERLEQIMKDGLRAEFARRTLKEVISEQREAMMQALLVKANEEAKGFGIEIVDVRVKRINLPDEVSSSVYNRMRSERKRVANELRSEGHEQSEKIRSDADRQVQVLLAEAQAKAEQIRGEGDAQSAATYAQAYGSDAEFYAFYRSLQAYRNSFTSGRDVMIVDPDSSFFEYFQNESGETAKK
ncbi:MAG: protease modulator HflC [bacterium]